MLSLHTLGELRLVNAAGAELLPGRRKELVLLAFLARRARPVPRAELAALLWGERPEANARNSLRQVVFHLKRILGDALRADAEALSVDASVIQLDLIAIEQAIASGRFAEAVARWDGDFLNGAEDIGDESCRLWIEEERQRVRKRLAWACERLVTAATRAGDRAAALHWAERWSGALPLDERAHIQLIQALRLAGRLGDARAHHAGYVARCHEVLDSEPSAQFLRLASELDAEVLSASEELTVSDERRALTSGALVGRNAVFGELTKAWSKARNGSGAVILIESDEGLGKSRLGDELLRWRSHYGGEACVLRAVAAGDQRRESWSTLRELFTNVVDAPGLIGVSPATLAELSRLLPTLRERFPRLPSASTEEFALRDAVVQATAAVSTEIPILIFVDDIDRTDAATTRALLAVASHISELRALVVLTARPEVELEPDSSDELPLRASLARLPRYRAITLAPLGANDVELLVASVISLDQTVRAALAQRLRSEAEGNPRFVLDTIAALITEGLLREDPAGEWHLASHVLERPLPVPSSMRGAIARRLARVSPEARALAETMAVSPVPIDLEALGRLRRLSTPSLHAAVDELLAQRLVAATAEGPARYTFASDASRRAITLSMSGETRTALQLAVVEVTETKPATTTADISRARPHKRSRAFVAAIATIVLGAMTATGLFAAHRGHATHDIIAVGLIRDFAAPDSNVGGALADMLATNLARVPALNVLSNARMLEVIHQIELAHRGAPADSADQRRTVLNAAQIAGAADLVEGELYRDSAKLWRLDLRRVDAHTGVVRDAASVEGANLFQLVDMATARLASGSKVGSDTLRIADVTTTSVAAYRFYEEGLRAYYQNGDVASARVLFRAAAREDSSFAMARYYLALMYGGGPPGGWAEFRIADSLADHASDRERLLIRARWALERNDPTGAALAETLAVRYPNEPDGLLILTMVRASAGDFLGAIPLARRAMALDSVPPSQGERAPPVAARCLACDALYQISTQYWLSDSMAAAIRTGQDAIRLGRDVAGAWGALAFTYQNAERYADALEAWRKAQSLRPEIGFPYFFINQSIRTGDFAAADRLLDGFIHTESSITQGPALWWYAISLLHQGRVAEALAAAQREREIDERADPSHILAFDARSMEALSLLDLGRGREAAAQFDSLAEESAPRGPLMRSRAARHRAWMLTQAASALAAAGDTIRLGRLADSIQSLGTESVYGRDGRLHHHVRGLLYEARGQWDAAARELRQAIFSWTLGYTRTNLELGRTLLQLHRPEEAIAALRPALHGSLDANNTYVTRTELQEMLARAFDTAGQRDSARTYYKKVADAWRQADPQYKARQAFAEHRAASLAVKGR